MHLLMPSAPSTQANSPSTVTSYYSVQDEIAEARAERAQMIATLKTRGKVANCASGFLMPVTVLWTGFLGCLAIPCSFKVCYPGLNEKIWEWRLCTAKEGREGPEAGTKCPGISPCTMCNIETEEGLIFSLATEQERARLSQLDLIIQGIGM